MFKKTKIAAATVALLGAAAMQSASAVSFDSSGRAAQVLIFPYYNTNNAFMTSFNIRNTKNEAKAVKIRLREGKISNDVLDFNLYMSPYDRFSFAVGVDAKGVPTLYARDTSCTFPTIPNTGVPLRDYYQQTQQADITEGYVEIIEMGRVDPKAVVTDSGYPGGSRSIVSGITHLKATDAPLDCTVVEKAWGQGVFNEGGATATVLGVDHTTVTPGAMLAPTGGLQGWAYLLDFANGNAFVNVPAAIRNYQTTWAQHYRSDNIATYLLPSLASGNVHNSLVENNDGKTFIDTRWNETADYVKTPFGQLEVLLDDGINRPDASGRNPYPIAHVLAATGFTNDYLTLGSTNQVAKTDWLINFPMRKHGIYSYLKYPTGNTQGAAPTDGDVKFTPVLYNKEEQTVVVNNQDFSPYRPGVPELLDREVNILSFGLNIDVKAPLSANSTALKSTRSKPISVSYNEGWGSLMFALANGHTDPAVAAITAGFSTACTKLSGTTVGTPCAYGIPTLGFAAMAGKIDGASGNNEVSETLQHVFIRNNP